jgi:hypothetical protein
MTNLLDNLQQIFEGWFKYFFRTIYDEKVSQYRLSVCNTCPNMKYLIDFKILKYRVKLFKQCKICLCILAAKSRSSSPCPIGLWKI